jgi:hypothetical protein
VLLHTQALPEICGQRRGGGWISEARRCLSEQLSKACPLLQVGHDQVVEHTFWPIFEDQRYCNFPLYASDNKSLM